MIHLVKKLTNKLSNLAEAFANSNIVKAWEQAAIKRAEYYISKTTMKELQALSDKELHDIGINRGEIYNIAHRVHKNT
jgi:uncharacterized protein YjiS (DUF1127 family)